MNIYHKLINQFEFIHKLVTKHGLYLNLKNYYREEPSTSEIKNFVHNILPTTFVIKGGEGY
jgi:hypothetical protein